MKATTILVPVLVLGMFATSLAAPKKFTLGGEKLAPRQIASVESEADFENFVGRTNKITGTVSFDPAKKTGSGTVVVDLASIDTGIPLRNEHMQGEDWLNTAKHPNGTFRTTAVKSLGGDKYSVKGQFTLRGVTKAVSTTATVRYAKASAATKAAGFSGDAIQVRTSFKIKLSDYGIVISGQAKGKVANVVTISLTTWGVSE